MNRDLVFFVAGLGFGLAGGYFVFQALDGGAPAETRAGATAAPTTATSPIGLDAGESARELDADVVAGLEARAEENPDDATVRAELGKLYLDAGRFEEAARWLDSAVRLSPGDLDARNRLALAQLNAGDLDATVSTYEGTLAIEPNHPASLLGLGRVRLYLQQDIDGGLSLWQKLVSVAPESAEALSVRDELEALQSAHAGS